MTAPKRPDVAYVAQGAGAAVGLVALVLAVLAVGPAILMLATDLLHNTYAAVPELSFVNSVLVVIIARVLLGGAQKLAGDA